MAAAPALVAKLMPVVSPHITGCFQWCRLGDRHQPELFGERPVLDHIIANAGDQRHALATCRVDVFDILGPHLDPVDDTVAVLDAVRCEHAELGAWQELVHPREGRRYVRAILPAQDMAPED